MKRKILDIENPYEYMLDKLNNYNGMVRYEIPFDYSEWARDSRQLTLWKIVLVDILTKKNSIEPFTYIDYINGKILIVERITMKYTLTIEIPYKNKSNYYNYIIEVNNVIDHNGCVLVAVNNNIYNLSFFLVIETNNLEQINNIKTITLRYKLKINNEIGFNEVIDSIFTKSFNYVTLMANIDINTLEDMLAPLVYFKDEKNKIFISYSHKDKYLVKSIIEKLKIQGFNMWIDELEIDIGDNILDKVNQGINECDLAMVFLSNNTITSLFAKHEFKIFFNKIIYTQDKTNKWFIVKLDDVELDKIYSGLGGYLYYQIENEIDFDDLVSKLNFKLNKL